MDIIGHHEVQVVVVVEVAVALNGEVNVVAQMKWM
jgi:hypothetical protein